MHLGWTAERWDAATDDQRNAHLEALRGHFQLYLDAFIERGLIRSDVVVDESIYHDVVRHYYEDLGRLSRVERITHPNEVKQKAFYAFWIRKLKPISAEASIVAIKDDSRNWINEIVGLSIAIWELDCNLKPNDTAESTTLKDLPADLFRDLLYYFRYKSVSPHSLYLILAMMYR